MEEKNIINPEESLAIIQEMVLKTKSHYSDNSFYFILWGWLTFIASLAHYFLIPFYGASSSLVWLLMPIGGVISVVYGTKKSKGVKVRTHLETYIANLWTALGLGLIVLVTGTVLLKSGFLLPIFILLYAIGTFTTGSMIQFKPLIIGGIVCFAISLFSFFLSDKNQLLMIALAVLVSYLIPGHSLKNRFKQQTDERS